MKKIAIMLCIATGLAACGVGDKNKGADPYDAQNNSGNGSYDPEKGEGKFTNVTVSATLDTAKASQGEKLFAAKCYTCHKLTAEKLVGPGWQDVTKRKSAAWIMNFAGNPEAMLDKDPEAKAQLANSLIRMPNQNLSDDDVRNVYEFMRKNDGLK